MNIAFFGTGEFSKNILAGVLKRSEVNVKLVVSQHDKPIGRKKIITPTPIKEFALERGIEVMQPERLSPPKSPSPEGDLLENPPRVRGQGGAESFYQKLESLNLDFIVVVAYGKIVPERLLNIPKHGCINIHGSILPDYRGASPIQESLKNGDSETGLTIMYMSKGMDEGDILKIEKIPVDIMDKTPDIFEKFEKLGPDLLIKTLKQILAGEISGEKQDDSKATYCNKIEKSDGKINFETEDVFQIYNKFRAYTPWPGIFTYYNSKKFSIEDCFFEECEIELDGDFKIGDVIEYGEEKGIICKGGILILKQIKLEGKKTMDINSFVNGNKEFLEYNFC